MQEHKGTFTATDEAGNQYQIHIYVDVIHEGTLVDPHATSEGLKSLVTSERHNVNVLGKGEYEVVQTGVRLTSDDPDAP